MTASLSTQFHRALFALPLLAVGLAAAFAADPQVAAALPLAPAAVSPLPATPALALALVANVDCESALAPGALGLARMPGDIGALGRRLRCAQ